MSDLVFSVWLLMLGAVGGSAMAALADRLLAGRSWLSGRSACATCGELIALQDLVPVVSYLRLGGRCRSCGALLPRRLLAAEVAGIGCAALALLIAEGRAEQLSGAVFLLVLLGLFLTDLSTMRLPDVLTGPLALAGLWVGASWHGIGASLAASVIGVGVFFGLAYAYERLRGRPGLGRGDIKMMAGLSAMAGPLGIPWVTLIAALTALAVTGLRSGSLKATAEVPMGCHLAVAGAIIWVAKGLNLL